MRYQVLLSDELHFDLVNYAKDNSIKPQEVVRHLIREEVYRRQSLAKKANTLRSGTLNAPRRAGKTKKAV